MEEAKETGKARQYQEIFFFLTHTHQLRCIITIILITTTILYIILFWQLLYDVTVTTINIKTDITKSCNDSIKTRYCCKVLKFCDVYLLPFISLNYMFLGFF